MAAHAFPVYQSEQQSTWPEISTDQGEQNQHLRQADLLYKRALTMADRAEILAAMHDALQNALDGLNERLSLDPDDPLVIKFERWAWEFGVRETPPANAQAKYDNLLQASESGQCEPAERLAAEILSGAPLFTYTYIVLGDCYFQNNNWEEALKRYRHAAKANPGYGRAYARIAECEDRLGHTNEALSAYIRSVMLEPGSFSLTESLSIYAYAHEYKVLLHRVERMSRVMYTPEGKFKILLKTGKEASKEVSAAWLAYSLEKVLLYRKAAAQNTRELEPSFEIERASFETLVAFWQEAKAKNPHLQDEDLDFLLQIKAEHLLEAFVYVCYFRPEFEKGYQQWRLQHEPEIRKLFEKYLVVIDPNQVKFKEAEVLFADSKYEEALAQFKESARGFIESRDPGIKDVLATCLNLMGRASRILGRTEEAFSYQNDARKMLHELEIPKSEASVLNSLALTATDLGRFDEALADFKQALALDRSRHDTVAEVSVLVNMGSFYLTRGQTDQAQAVLEEALGKSGGGKIRGAVLYSNFGSLHSELGHYKLATEFFEKALAAAQSAHDKITEMTIASNLGSMLTSIGEYSKAKSHLEEALSSAKSMKDKHAEAIALNGLGTVALESHDLHSALEAITGSYTIMKEIKNRHGEAMGLLNLGSISVELGEKERALSYWHDAQKIAQEMGDRTLEAAALNNIAPSLDKPREQLSMVTRAISLISTRSLEASDEDPYPVPRRQDITNGRSAQSLLANQGGLLYKLAGSSRRDAPADERKYLRSAVSALTIAADLVEETRQGMEPIGIETESSGVSYLAEKFEAFETLVAAELRLHDLEPTHRWDIEAFKHAERTKSRILLELLNQSKAKSFSGVPDKEIRAEKQYELRIGAIKSQMAIAGASSQNTLQAELHNLISDFETFKKNLRAQYPKYAQLKYTDPATAADVQAALDGDSAVIEYFAGRDFFAEWLIKKNMVRVVVLKDPKSLLVRAERYRQTLTQPGKLALEEGHNLYAELLGHFHTELKGISRLIIVPDGELFRLPFQALVSSLDNNQPRYLVEEFAISYVQSSSVLISLAQGTGSSGANRKSLFAMGRPSYSGSAAQSTASLSTTEMKAIATRGEEVNKDAYSYYLGSTIPTDLPATEVEVDEIGKLLHSTESVFKHEKATKHRVKDYSSRGLLKGYKYLHFATHGFVSDELPALSALVLAPDEGSKEDGFLTVGEVYGLELTSDLVTLSACELGLGKLEKGEGVIGFTRAFMYAGTPSVAVSLWSVADDRTAVLMQDFYKNMANGMPRDRALQQAQVSMIHQADSKNTSMNRATQPVNSATESANHPYFWAPFVLYGTSK